MFSRILALCFLSFVLSACGSSSSDNSAPASPSAPKSPNGGAHAPAGKLAAPSLKSELDKGKTLTLTFTSAKLASDVNERMNTRNLITLQDGKETIGGDDMKNWCQIGSENGYVNGGDRFNLKTADVQDKIYLAARQVYFKISSHLGFQCRKGGMDQSDMTLDDLQQIMGSLIKLDLSN